MKYYLKVEWKAWDVSRYEITKGGYEELLKSSGSFRTPWMFGVPGALGHTLRVDFRKARTWCLETEREEGDPVPVEHDDVGEGDTKEVVHDE